MLALYGWAYFADIAAISQALLVGNIAAALAAVSLVVALVSYLWAPAKHIVWFSLSAYLLLAITTATLIMSTGGAQSPFIALWMLIAVFAGVFGAYGIVPLFILPTAYLVHTVTAGAIPHDVVTMVVLGGYAPLAVSYLIWHTKASGSKSDDAYHDLANELSQVAGKSDIVINAIADGVIAIDSKGIIELINPSAQRIIGWVKQDTLGLSYKSVLKLLDGKGEELSESNEPISQVLANNKPVSTNNLILVTNSGKNLLISLAVSPVGQIGSGVIIVFRDITKEKAEEREQAEFISTASHEMRTPVASIEGYLGLVLNPNTAQIDDRARDFIVKAHESAEHLGRLFQDLLDVSKADDGRLQNDPSVVNVVEYIHDIVQGLKPRADEKKLRLTYKPKPDETDETPIEKGDRHINPIYYVNVDPDHLREVVANLVENAIKYTPAGDVIIDVTEEDDDVKISVQDSGIGIPPEDVGHLFQKFYRVDSSETREIGGTGLGLYLCRRLTEAMNGRIWVESEYKRGSTFFLEIPRLPADEATRMIEQSTVAAEEAAKSAPVIGPAHIAPTSTPLETTIPLAADTAAPVQLQPVAPIAPPQPEPVQQPTYQQPSVQPAQQTAANAPPANNRINIPLTAIEQNKDQYIADGRRGPISPPERQ